MGFFDSLFGEKEKKEKFDPVSYLKSKFDGNINDVPHIDIYTNILENEDFSISKSDVDFELESLNILVNVGKTTKIPDSLYEGVFKSLTDDNKPYISLGIGSVEFSNFIQGLKELGYEKWWKYRLGKCKGITKDELITLRGEPENTEIKLDDNDNEVLSFIYGNSKKHHTYFEIQNNIITKFVIRD